ncbi:MAG: carboxypeptidase regulatory-like domain-containing protein [Desulfobacteraceae bacterium]|jgi:Fe-S-cluster-containing dehydrogenase component
MKKGFALLIDSARCTACHNCFLACKDEHCGEAASGIAEAQPMTGQFWIDVIEKERGTFPKVKLSNYAVTCMHCRNAPCVKAAKDGAVYRRDDGIVIIDPVKAVGQKQIVDACPYRVIYWNEEKQLPQKCTMCAHLLDQGWKKPRCVEMCPTGALSFTTMEDLEAGKFEVWHPGNGRPEPLHPEYGCAERVLYLNVPKKFIAGTVVFADTDQCAKGVNVELTGDGISENTVTDGFGDFWFENLEGNLNYQLNIQADGYNKISRTIRTLNDVNVGEVFLEKTI